MSINDSILESETLQYLEKNPDATVDELKKRFYKINDQEIDDRVSSLKTKDLIQEDNANRLTKKVK